MDERITVDDLYGFCCYGTHLRVLNDLTSKIIIDDFGSCKRSKDKRQALKYNAYKNIPVVSFRPSFRVVENFRQKDYCRALIEVFVSNAHDQGARLWMKQYKENENE